MTRKYSRKKLHDAITELERELQSREQRYPDMIERKKLNRDLANNRCDRLRYAIEILTMLKKEPEINKQLKMF